MGFHFLKKSSKNIEMAPRGARSKLLIFDEALECARGGGEGQLFSTASRLPGETGEVSIWVRRSRPCATWRSMNAADAASGKILRN